MLTDLRQTLHTHLKRNRTAFYILPYFWRYRRALGVSALLVLLATAADLLFPFFAVYLFTRISSGSFGDVVPELIVLGLLYLVSMIGHYFSNIQMTLLGERAVVNLRTDLYTQFHRLPLQFFVENHSGDLISRLSSDITAIGVHLSHIFTNLVTQIVTLIGVIVILIMVDWRLGLILPLIILPLTILSVLLSLVLNRLSSRMQQHLAQAFLLAEDGLQGIATVRAYHQEQREIARFRAHLEQAYGRVMQMTYWQSGIGAALAILGRIAATIVLVLVGQAVFLERFTMQQVLTFAYYATVLWGALSGLMWLYFNIQIAGGATERVFAILQTDPIAPDRPDAHPLKIEPGATLQFQDVDFCYEDQMPVLRGFNLTVGAGETLALVGMSGAGKTTIARLLLRFYDPQRGSISLGGVNLRDVSIASLREQIGLVSQDPFLFATSIAENIRYGMPDASDARIEQAALLAQAHDFIRRLPDGYQTLVGEQGIRLSRGQKQRIALARLILCDPRIIILDEFTSALDKETEALVTATIRTHFRDRILLLITHHPSLTRLADRVAVLDEGRIVECGSHLELLAHGEFYPRLLHLHAGEGS